MAKRDKSRDDKFFNCSQPHEHNYVASLYERNQVRVANFLVEACGDSRIRYSTHMEVYELIEEELDLPIPPST